MMADHMMIEVGQTIKGYELVENIGKGGFGSVFRAYQANLGREVAVKVILPELANQPEFIRRFELEAQLVARLEHLHIVPLYDYWRDTGGAFLVMRWLRGGNLKSTLAKNPFNLQSASLLLDQISAGLATAHGQNVIHRDIKPSNILLDEEGNGYLADFGIAKDLETSLGKETRSGGIIGSLDYLSPEQARSQPVSPQTDIYSLGVTLFEILTGEHPFPNLSGVERLYKHINDPLPAIHSVPFPVQDAVNEVIQKATAKNPRHRYEHVLAFAADFRQAAQLNEDGRTSLIEALTFREQEILEKITVGKSNREIADELFVEISTVKWYIRQIYRKLDVRNRRQAIIRAGELNLLLPGPNGEIADQEKSVLSIALPAPVNPYKGLRPFATADAVDFFGRDALVQKLGHHFTSSKNGSSALNSPNRFLAVVGPSGSGKSSVIHAGLVPRIIQGDLPGTENWFVAQMTPGSRPLDELEVTLIRLAVSKSDELRSQLERDEFGLQRALDIILPQDGSEVLLVIDQFEELFTMTTDLKQRQQFLDLLTAAVTDPRSRLRLIISLRADFYDRPLQFPHFGELVRSHIETVLPLSAEELERAIVQPSQRVGVDFEEGLVTRIIEDVLYQPGALPMLQFTLTELFEQRDGRLLSLATYDQIGGITGALASRAETLYQEYDENDQEKIRQLFLRLVTVDERQEAVPDTRRRVPRSELVSQAEEEDLVDDIIDTFAAYRLLTLDHNPVNRYPTVEVAHEALLREWERLRLWLNEARDDIRQARKVSRAAEEWEEHYRDESYLLRGARLEQVEKWQNTTTLVQTQLEQEFITLSLMQRNKEDLMEIERREREAQLELRSRNFLRSLVAVFAVATMIAIGLSVLAFSLNKQSLKSAAEFRSIALTFGAQDALNRGQPDVALALAREAVNMANPPFVAQEMFYTASSSNWIQRQFETGSGVRMDDAVYHPDGQRMITTSWDGRTIVWDIETGAELQSIQREDAPLLSIAIHPNGNLVAVGSIDGVMQIWNLETDEVIELVMDERGHAAPIFSPDGAYLVTSNWGRINIWETESFTLVRSFEGHDGIIYRFQFSPDGSLLVSASGDGTVKIWDFSTGELLQVGVLVADGIFHETKLFDVEDPPQLGDIIRGGAFSASMLSDGEHILIGTDEGRVILWNWRTDENIWSIQEQRPIQDIAVSPDEQTFVIGLDNPVSEAQVRFVDTGKLIHVYQGHTFRVSGVDFSPDGQHILTASNYGKAIIWPANWESTTRTIDIHSNNTIIWHPTQPLIATVGIASPSETDSTIRLIDTDTGEVKSELIGHSASVTALAFSPDGRFLLSGDEEDNLFIWDIESGEIIHSADGHLNATHAIAFNSSGQFVANDGNARTTIGIWSLATGERIGNLEGHQDWVQALQYSPDERLLYSGSRDGKLYQWDTGNREIVREFVGHDNQINSIDLSSDGTKLLTGSADQTAIVWDTQTGEILLTLRGHSGYITRAEFSPDESRILTSSLDGRVIIWDAETGALIFIFAVADNPINLEATFSPDGTQIVSAANDIITFWDITNLPDDYETWVPENRFIPDLTCKQRALYIIEPLCESEG